MSIVIVIVIVIIIVIVIVVIITIYVKIHVTIDLATGHRLRIIYLLYPLIFLSLHLLDIFIRIHILLLLFFTCMCFHCMMTDIMLVFIVVLECFL